MQTNKPAPDFELPDLQGGTLRLSDRRDGIGILRHPGAVDDATSRLSPKETVDSLLEGHLPTLTETPACGCVTMREI